MRRIERVGDVASVRYSGEAVCTQLHHIDGDVTPNEADGQHRASRAADVGFQLGRDPRESSNFFSLHPLEDGGHLRERLEGVQLDGCHP